MSVQDPSYRSPAWRLGLLTLFLLVHGAIWRTEGNHRRVFAAAGVGVFAVGVRCLGEDFLLCDDAFGAGWFVFLGPERECCDGHVVGQTCFLEMGRETVACDSLVHRDAANEHCLGTGRETESGVVEFGLFCGRNSGRGR